MDIRESLGLLDETITTGISEFQEDIEQLLKDKNFKGAHELIDKLDEINALQEIINTYMNQLELEDLIETNIIDYEQEQQKEDKKSILNYGEYIVDSAIEYSLYDDFTHKCPAGFSLQGVKIEARQWKDVLIHTCELLADKDCDKFYSFSADPSMQGKKVNYISKTQEKIRKPVKLSNYDMYIETNLSANSIRNLLIKLLKKYSIKIADYKVYLRADYTDLH